MILACRRNSASFKADAVGDALALQALQARLDHAELAAVHHHRHARDVGPAAMRLRNLRMASTPSIMPSSRFTPITCAPFSHLLAGYAHGLVVLAVLRSVCGRRRAARDVRALADIDELEPGKMRRVRGR